MSIPIWVAAGAAALTFFVGAIAGALLVIKASEIEVPTE